jgi:hypothetical protein
VVALSSALAVERTHPLWEHSSQVSYCFFPTLTFVNPVAVPELLAVELATAAAEPSWDQLVVHSPLFLCRAGSGRLAVYSSVRLRG